MLLSEQLLLEGLYDIKELIFNKPDLIQSAKQCFVNGRVACHALNMHSHEKISCNKIPHEFAIAKLLAKENAIYTKAAEKYETAIRKAEQANDRKAAYEIRKKRDKVLSQGFIPAVEPRIEAVKSLYPYALQKDGKVACMYVTPDKLARIRVILNLQTNMIMSVFKFRPEDIDSRIIEFESIELLLLKVYGTLNVSLAKTYAAIKNFTSSLLTPMKKEKIMNKFFREHDIAPQVKQQAIRKFEEELRTQV